MTNYIVGGNIRRWRQFRGYQQAEFAKKVGLSVVSISKYENGRTKIPITTLVKIADFLEIDLKDMLDNKS